MGGLSPFTLAVLAGVLSLTGPARAQALPETAAPPACRSHTDVKRLLGQQFNEHLNATGLQANGHLVEVFVSNDGRSWTIVVTRPDGWSCIVAVGEHWEALPGPINGPLA